MLNPLSKHKSARTDHLTGDENDCENPLSLPDTAGYIALNNKNTTTINMDETIPTTPKTVPIDYKLNQQFSTSSNNLLKPDNNPWNTNNNENELMRNKSQSISNIAGKIKILIKFF
jgi:hypothetical protein